MRANRQVILGGVFVLVGLSVIGFGGRAVSMIGTKDYFSADAWSIAFLIVGTSISAFGYWISGVRIKSRDGKVEIKFTKKR
jgi:hypothetical protein